MASTNTLDARPSTGALVQVGRLYLLTRDAYLSAPALARVKLEALEDLRGTVGAALTASGLPADLCAVSGVRLVDTLRVGLHRASRTTVRQERELVLLDILTTTRPGGSEWSAPLESLAVDIAGILLPEMPPAKAAQLVRRHRATTASLLGNLRRTRPHTAIDSPVEIVADMFSGVYGLDRPAALCAALSSLDGLQEDPAGQSHPRTALCGGALFNQLQGSDRPVLHRLVGGALSMLAPDAFAHQVATLDLVFRQRPDLAEPLQRHISDLRADIEVARSLDPEAAFAALASLDTLDKAMRPRRTLGSEVFGRLRQTRLRGLHA